MPKFWRTCSAVWLAALLVVLAGGVAVDAQRPVEGQLFWMSGPTAVPGSLWFAPEKRAWSGDWRLGTSYPHRIWANQVTAAPENDACFPTDLGYTDLHVGPYGLQVGQWFADWWDPQVWREHPNPPADWRFALYGGFWFLPNPFRQAVVNGMPERGPGPGTRSFCAAYELAVQRGDGRSGTWEPAMEEARGPCYAVSRIFRLRINTELRCEPDLRLANDFTVRWWEFYNAFIPQPFFDGTQGLKRFPESYAAPVHWFRRVEATYSQWGPLGGATPVYSVFRRPSGGGLYTRAGGLGGALADRAPYLDHHAWRFQTPAQINASDRNLLVETNADGSRGADVLNLVDVVSGNVDCMQNRGRTAGNSDQMMDDCPAYVSRLTSSFTMQAGRTRVEDMGSADLWQARQRGLLPAEGFIRAAPPDAQPAATDFWMDWTDWLGRCDRDVLQTVDIVRAAQQSYHAHYGTSYGEYQRYVEMRNAPRGTYTEEAIDAQYRYAVDFFEEAQGWLAIRGYREQVALELEGAFAGWYLNIGGSSFLPTVSAGDVSPLPSCSPGMPSKLAVSGSSAGATASVAALVRLSAWPASSVKLTRTFSRSPSSASTAV